MTVYSVISLQKIPYIYTVYDRIFGDFPAKNTVHAPCIYRVMANLYHLCCKARVWLVLNRKRGCATCCLYAMGCAATFVVCGVGWACNRPVTGNINFANQNGKYLKEHT